MRLDVKAGEINLSLESLNLGGFSESWRGLSCWKTILIAGFFSSMDLLGFGMCRARILFRSSLGWNLMGKMLGIKQKRNDKT